MTDRPLAARAVENPGETSGAAARTISRDYWTWYQEKASRLLVRPITVSVEACVLTACAAFLAFGNFPFWRALLAGRELSDVSAWLFAACVFVSITLLHFTVLALVCNRWTTKPILIALCAINAAAIPLMSDYGVHLDPSMVRNIVSTDSAEAAEYLNARSISVWLVLASVPIWLLIRVRVVRRPLVGSALRRGGWLITSLLGSVVIILPVMREFAPLMRTQKQIRYLITPGNYVYSTAKVLGSSIEKEFPRLHAAAVDTHTADPMDRAHKPVMFVLVIGETARADNFALNGYARDTNPLLAKLNVINFSNVVSCGTATAVSLPCMLSAVGRDGYQTDIARREDGLMQVLSHAGYRVHWRDNNSGCKGTCEGDGISVLRAADSAPELCSNGRCLDEVLLRTLRSSHEGGLDNEVIVLHQLGNHGPAYYQRYPNAFRKFKPTCDTAELRSCSSEEITNAYDNAILYTDYILAKVVRWLESRASDYNTAMLYVGDHGESLGERGMYLHGLPYAVAPHEQIHVPMVLWMSDAFRDDFDIDTECVRARALLPLSHDNLFHSVTGLLSVETSSYNETLDVFNGCKKVPAEGEGRARRSAAAIGS